MSGSGPRKRGEREGRRGPRTGAGRAGRARRAGVLGDTGQGDFVGGQRAGFLPEDKAVGSPRRRLLSPTRRSFTLHWPLRGP